MGMARRPAAPATAQQQRVQDKKRKGDGKEGKATPAYTSQTERGVSILLCSYALHLALSLALTADAAARRYTRRSWWPRAAIELRTLPHSSLLLRSEAHLGHQHKARSVLQLLAANPLAHRHIMHRTLVFSSASFSTCGDKRRPTDGRP
jgi:hypothetical protein